MQQYIVKRIEMDRTSDGPLKVTSRREVMQQYIVKRIEMDRTSDGPLKPYTRFRIVQRTGEYGDGGKFIETEEPKVLEDGLLLKDAKARVKYWREKDEQTDLYFWGQI
jgi:hypothetical protein